MALRACCTSIFHVWSATISIGLEVRMAHGTHLRPVLQLSRTSSVEVLSTEVLLSTSVDSRTTR
jgi:hypothetical protein